MRDARRVERGVGVPGHHIARAPRGGNRLVGGVCDGDDFRGNLGCDLTLQRRIEQRHAIHARIIHDRLQRAADQREIIKYRSRHIHRVAERAV